MAEERAERFGPRPPMRKLILAAVAAEAVIGSPP